MRINTVSIFPSLFSSFFSTSLVEKAVKKGILTEERFDIRSFSKPPHFRVDDTPYGGGPGMIMSCPPLDDCLEHIKTLDPHTTVIFPLAGAPQFTQKSAVELSSLESLTFVCGRYEGIDQRIIDLHADHCFSIGDYVLMGGEVPTMAMIEAIVRLVPGVIGNVDSTVVESFCDERQRYIEAPHYTKPREYKGMSVPDVLCSGHHKHIDSWRRKQSETRAAQIEKINTERKSIK